MSNAQFQSGIFEQLQAEMQKRQQLPIAEIAVPKAIPQQLGSMAVEKTVDTKYGSFDLDEIPSISKYDLTAYLDIDSPSAPVITPAEIPTVKVPKIKVAKPVPEKRGNFRERHRFLFFGSAVLVAAGIANTITTFGEGKPKDSKKTAVSQTTTLNVPELTSPATTVVETTTTGSTLVPTTSTEATTTTTAAKTTTELKPYSYMEALLAGEISLQETSGHRYASINIPKLCLEDIHAYGSNKGSANDPEVLKILEEQGLLTPEMKNALSNGTHESSANVSQLFDPIYYNNIDETPQVACEDNVGSARSARWTGTPQGSTAAKNLANYGVKLNQVQPIVDIDYRGVAPGQPGNVVLSGHRTTENAALANIDALKSGDTIVITVDNGDKFVYTVVATEIVQPDPNGLNTILQYKNGYSDSTLTMYSCDDGGDTRYVVRAILQK